MGILVHWLVSSRLVFADGAAARGTGERHRQKLLFVGSALVGLAVTTAIVGGGSALGLDPRLAKIAADVGSFQPNYYIGRESCGGERCKYVWSSGVGRSSKKHNKQQITMNQN